MEGLGTIIIIKGDNISVHYRNYKEQFLVFALATQLPRNLDRSPLKLSIGAIPRPFSSGSIQNRASTMPSSLTE